jgi:hypothetical protein
MDGVLKRLDEVLQVLDARLQGLKPGRVISRSSRSRRRWRRIGRAADLTDPRNQPFSLAHRLTASNVWEATCAADSAGAPPRSSAG